MERAFRNDQVFTLDDSKTVYFMLLAAYFKYIAKLIVVWLYSLRTIIVQLDSWSGMANVFIYFIGRLQSFHFIFLTVYLFGRSTLIARQLYHGRLNCSVLLGLFDSSTDNLCKQFRSI